MKEIGENNDSKIVTKREDADSEIVKEERMISNLTIPSTGTLDSRLAALEY